MSIMAFPQIPQFAHIVKRYGLPHDLRRVGMKCLKLVLMGLLGCTACALGVSPISDPSAVVAGNTAFACDLYGKLRAQPGNVFYSPFSISAALAMTAAGAKGATYEEMARVLHLPPGDSVHTAFASLHHQLNANPNVGFELSVANALWGQQGFAFQPTFINNIGKNYGGGLRPVDFGKPADAAKIINRWVEEQTKNHIKDLVRPDMFDRDSRLVLTNAIYFKGLWTT